MGWPKPGRLCIDCEFHVLQSEDVTEKTVKRCKKSLWQDQSITLIKGMVPINWAQICDSYSEGESHGSK